MYVVEQGAVTLCIRQNKAPHVKNFVSHITKKANQFSNSQLVLSPEDKVFPDNVPDGLIRLLRDKYFIFNDDNWLMIVEDKYVKRT